MNAAAPDSQPARVKRRRIGGRTPFHWAMFQLHWVFGISIGLVLAVMGVTGSIMAFEDQIMEASSFGIVNVEPKPAPVLSPDHLLDAFAAQIPGAKPTSLTLRTRPGASPQVTFAPPVAAGATKPSAQKLYLDPYSGRILGHARGEQFFATVRRLHRFLLLPGGAKGAGRQITGIAAISLLGFLLSGLYLRWPRRPLNWRLWLKPHLNARGRGLYLTLHQVIGTWVLPVYLVAALTGLTYSYPWYKAGFDFVLTGKSTVADEAEPAPAKSKDRASGKAAAGHPAARLDTAWRATLRENGGPTTIIIITLPKSAKAPVRVRYLLPTAGNERAFNELSIDGETGEVRDRDLFARNSLGERMASARLAVHRGTFFGLPFAILFMLAAALMPLFPITGYLLYFNRRAAARRTASSQNRQM